MSASSSDGDKLPPLTVHRQRGRKFESSNPELRLDSAMARLDERRADLIRIGQRCAVRLALEGRIVTADDLRTIDVGEIRRHFAGAVFRTLNAARVLIADGYRPSLVPGSHARPILGWILRDRVIAEQWLRDHPDPDPLAPPMQRHLWSEA